MDGLTPQINSNPNPESQPHYHNPSKSFQHSSSPKSLSGSQELTELRTWYSEAHTYYNNVLKGNEPQPDTAAWNEFIRQMNWTYQRLMAEQSAWNPLSPEGPGYEPKPDPFGAISGADGTLVHTTERAEFGFLGNDTRDIWSNEVILNVAPVSAKVTVEETTDTRHSPGGDIIKITVQDPATDTLAVYFIHNPKAKITINVPNEDQLNDETGKVEVGDFKDDSTPEEAVQSSAPGELKEGSNNHYIYEGVAGQPLVFYPEPGAAKEIHEVYGDSSIVALPSDHLVVSKGMPDDPDGYTILVTHRDGSEDKYYIRKGYRVSLHANHEYITWYHPDFVDPSQEGEFEEVPEEFQDRFTLNVNDSTPSYEEEDPFGDSTPSYSEDTPPDQVDGHEAHYTNSESVDIHANYDDSITDHFINAPGEVILHGADYTDKIKVEYDEAGNSWTIFIYPGGDTSKDPEVFHIAGGDHTKVILDVMGESFIIDSSDEAKRSVQIGLGGHSDDEGSEGDLSPTERLAKVDGIEMSASELEEKAQGSIDFENLPPIPNDNILHWLYLIDPELQNLLNHYDGTSTEESTVAPQIRNRLVVLLQALYPNVEISAASWDKDADPYSDDDIMFGNARVDIMKKGSGGSSDPETYGWLQFNVTYSEEDDEEDS